MASHRMAMVQGKVSRIRIPVGSRLTGLELQSSRLSFFFSIHGCGLLTTCVSYFEIMLLSVSIKYLFAMSSGSVVNVTEKLLLFSFCVL